MLVQYSQKVPTLEQSAIALKHVFQVVSKDPSHYLISDAREGPEFEPNGRLLPKELFHKGLHFQIIRKKDATAGAFLVDLRQSPSDMRTSMPTGDQGCIAIMLGSITTFEVGFDARYMSRLDPVKLKSVVTQAPTATA